MTELEQAQQEYNDIQTSMKQASDKSKTSASTVGKKQANTTKSTKKSTKKTNASNQNNDSADDTDSLSLQSRLSIGMQHMQGYLINGAALSIEYRAAWMFIAAVAGIYFYGEHASV